MSGTDTWQNSSGVQTLHTSPLDVTVYCQLQSNPAAAGGTGHCCRWWQEYVTKLVLSTVRGLALSSALRQRIMPFRIGRDKRDRGAEVETDLSSGLCLRDAVNFSAGAVTLFREPRWDTGVEGQGTWLCSSGSLWGRHVAGSMSVHRVCAQGNGLGHDTALCSFQSPYLGLFAWVKLRRALLVKFCCISP